ncbi:MAG TPA: sulfatase-like hydrolase/transferase, partial [Gemmata sp.]|nr:sulfatase-like hydrolase/transferase [Gemmata sp.]
KTKGYCTDVFTDAALKFIAADSQKPFFAYVAYNAPHAPYQVPDELAAHYRKLDLTEKAFPKVGEPWAGKKLNTEEIARAYGMIENLDANFGRLMKALEKKKLAENTLVIFLTDNGPGGVRWNAGLRNRKGTVYEGGIRVPCYVRWPKEAKPGTIVTTPLAHIDVLPTVLHVCGLPVPHVDGKTFRDLLRRPNTAWANRAIFFQWHRGDEPEKFRAFAVIRPDYKLVQANGVGEKAKWKPKFELFNLTNDPFEEHDIAAEKPEHVAAMKDLHAAWFADVTKKGFDPPRIIIGSEKENPVRLSRQDWRGPKAGWAPESEGYWEVKIERAGKYRVTVRAREEFNSMSGSVVNRGVAQYFGENRMGPGGTKSKSREMNTTVELEKGAARVEATVMLGREKRGAEYVELEFVGPAKNK